MGVDEIDFIYYQLRAFFLKREQQKKVTFKLVELTDLWLCTAKQCKRRLKQYEALGKLTYVPGRGRGNGSELIFRAPFQQEVQEIVEQALETNSLDDVIELLGMDIPKAWFDEVFQEIQGLFGVQQGSNDQDILRYILRRPITSLDPLKVAVSRESFLIHQLGDTLLQYEDGAHSLQPGLAHHWRVSKDYCQWTFFLRKGVRFHHGRMLTSEDVKYTLLRARNPESVVSWQLQNIEDISCDNEYVVTIHLNKGEPFFGHYLAMGNLAILPYDISFDEKRWVSTGPFKIRNYSDQSLTLEVFEDYYGLRPLMDRIEFWVIENQELPVTVLTDAEFSKKDEYVEYSKENVGVEFLMFNFQSQSVIQHPKFREAIYHLLDGVEMKKELAIGMPSSRFHPEKSKPVPKECSKVAELLEEAGYQGEVLTLGTFSYLEARKKAEWLQKRAAAYGIQLELRKMPISGTFYTKEYEEETDMMMAADVPIANQELAFLDFCSNPNLFCQRLFSKAILSVLNKKIEKMKFNEDYSKRQLIYEQIDQWLTTNYFLVYISHPVKRELIHSTIKRQGKEFFSNLDLRTVWAERGDTV
ncbi:ABC transporter substrate-binding protein [Enterococcus sp. LJL128]